MIGQENNNRTFDLVNIRYINFNDVKSVIFTKVELSIVMYLALVKITLMYAYMHIYCYV